MHEILDNNDSARDRGAMNIATNIQSILLSLPSECQQLHPALLLHLTSPTPLGIGFNYKGIDITVYIFINTYILVNHKNVYKNECIYLFKIYFF